MDVIIKNCQIVDGTGEQGYKGEIGIINNKIVKIEKEISNSATTTIDAKGHIVAPGFIDAHTHADLAVIIDKSAFNYLSQGVTTVVIGNCGFTAAPINKETVSDLLSLVGLDINVDLTELWTSFGDYLNFLRRSRIAINFIPLVGQGTLRIAVMGLKKRDPTDQELQEMKILMEESMEAGAFGLSAGLEYMPGSSTKTEELMEICKIVSKYNGIFAVHIRNEGDLGMEATKEVIDVARRTKVKLELSHIKMDGKRNWGKTRERLELIESARSEGIDVTGDVHPYTFCMIMLHALFPDWLFSDGLENAHEKLKNPDIQEKLKDYYKHGTSMLAPSDNEDWDNVILATSSNPKYKGKSVFRIAEENQQDIIATLSEIIQSDGVSTYVILTSMFEDDIVEIIKHPLVMIVSDGEVVSPKNDKIHPRFYGTYPRVLGRYVREKKIISLEEAIRKMTSFPAKRFGIQDRGILKEGNVADIVIFDPDKIIDRATMKEPNKLSEGIEYVIVNGKLVFDHGKFKRKYPGQILNRKSTK